MCQTHSFSELAVLLESRLSMHGLVECHSDGVYTSFAWMTLAIKTDLISTTLPAMVHVTKAPSADAIRIIWDLRACSSIAPLHHPSWKATDPDGEPSESSGSNDSRTIE